MLSILYRAIYVHIVHPPFKSVKMNLLPYQIFHLRP